MSDDENTLAFSLDERVSSDAQAIVADDAEASSVPETLEGISAPAGLNAGIRYNDVLDNVDIDYVVTPGGVKENIIIRARSDEYRFRFTLDTDGAEAILGDDGCVYIGEKYIIPAPVMYDDNKVFSRDAHFELEENDGTYTWTVVADEEWINAEERAFPVVVDPIVKYKERKFSYVDSEVDSTYPDSNYNGNMFPNTGVGRRGISRLYINLTEAPAIGEYSVVTSAQMTIKTMGAAYGPLTLCVYPVEEAWSAETITWNTQPALSDRISESVVCPDTETTFTFDVTEMVKEWAQDGGSNGFVLMAADEDGAVNNATFYSREYGGSEAPQLVITYRDQSGLHDEYSYTEFSAGNAGTAHVNNYNGSLVFVRDEITSKSDVLPVSVSHIYDSHSSDIQLGVGYGWRLSVHETISSETVGDKSFFVYTNGDGNRIYMDFVVEEGKYIDQDGLGYEYNMKTTPYELRTPYGTTKTFYENTDSTWFIKDETDSNGKKISYTYDSNNKLTSITDGSGNTISFSYSASRLASVTMGEHVLTYTYNAAGYLTSVVDNYITTGSCSYEYNNSGLLSRASDQLGQTVELSYDTDRVSGAAWYVKSGSNRVASNGCSFINNGGRSTSVLYAGNDGRMKTDDDITYNYSFDNSGMVILEYVQNAAGETIHTASYSENTALNSLGLNFGGISDVGYVSESPIFSDSFENGIWSAEAGATVSAESNEHLYGIQSMKAVFSDAGQRVSKYYVMTAGKEYTFSMYVKIPTFMSGVRLCVMDASYNELASSDKITDTVKYAETEWLRLSLDYTATDNTVKCIGLVSEGSGTVYADAAMLEVKTPLTPSVFTEANERFTSGNSGWSPFYTDTVSLYQNSIRLTGMVDKNVESSKKIQLNGSLDHGYILSGWAKADSLPVTEDNGRKFELFADVVYYDSDNVLHTDNTFTLPFNWECRDWQYVSGSVTIPEAAVMISHINVGVRYANNLNCALFDNIILTHGNSVVSPPSEEDMGLTEIKDSLDRVIQVKDADGNVVREYTYHGSGETVATEKYFENGNEVFVYSYDENGVLSTVVERVYDETANTLTSTITSSYNTDGTVASVTENAGDDTYVTTYVYSDGNLISVNKTKNGATVSLEEYEYDSEGNQTGSSFTTGGKKLRNSSSSTSDNVTSVKDSRDNISTYSYVDGLLSSQTNASGIATRYTYVNERITSQYLDEDMNGAFTSGEKRVQFYYDGYGRITSLMNGSSGYYGYNYNEAGLLSSVVLANRTLMEFEYNPAYTQLIGYTYGGVTRTYEYDIYGNLIAVRHNDVLRYSFKYNCLGLLESVYDADTGITRRYVFDTEGDEWSFSENGEYYTLERYTADVAGETKLIYSIDNTEYSYYTEYNEDTDVSSYRIPSGYKITTDTDDFGRLSSYTLSDRSGGPVIGYKYGYETWTDSENVLRTSELVSELNVGGKKYTYTYDENRNITSVSVNNVLKESYTYDAAGQLVRNDSAAQNKSFTYTYDNAGNVKSIKEYAYTLGTLGSELSAKSFSYNAAIDTMSRYNGTAVNYDASGNPTNWRDGMTFTWEGRELSGATAGGKTYQYFYNSDGIRTRTIEKDTTYYWHIHDYVLDGTKILAEKISGYYPVADYVESQSIIVYLYDENDSPIGLKYDGAYYYFTKNLQGDITGITNLHGAPFVEYTYDAWGNVLSVTGSMADTVGAANIFRYRGYAYDAATGLYYLQSRYYDPQCGRFLNPDDVSYLGESGTVLGWNLYTYCENDAVNKVDPSGCASICWMYSVEFWRENELGLTSVKNTYQRWFTNDKLINTYFYELESRSDFIERWNLLPYNLDVLVIDVHARKDALSIHSDREIISISDVNSLKYKRIKCLILLGCNAAHSSERWGNVAYRLFNRISGVLIASDGTVKATPWCYWFFGKHYYKVTYATVGDNHWTSLWGRQKIGKQYGWVIYKHRNKYNYWYSTTLSKKNVTAGDLLYYVLKCNLY